MPNLRAEYITDGINGDENMKCKQESWLHWLKWRLIRLFRICEFKVTCECGNKIKIIDGLRDAQYICKVCDAVWVANNKSVFT